MKGIRVLLLEDIRGLGEAGDVKNVRGGYARNYLLPKGLVVIATPESLKRTEEIKKVRQARLEKMKGAAVELAARIEETQLEMSLLMGEEGKAFGSVKAADIAAKLAEAGIAVEKGLIRLDNPIKALGDYEIPVHLHPEVTATLRLRVVAKE